MPRLTPQSDVKCCGTCRWADWRGLLTPTGRFKWNATSPCLYPRERIERELQEVRVPDGYRVRVLDDDYLEPSDGKQCPCYEKRITS